MKRRKKGSPLPGGIMIVLLLIAAVWLYTNPGGGDGSPSHTPAVTETAVPANAAAPSEEPFQVHFIDVGQADAILVLCDGDAMLVDGGNVADGPLVCDYISGLGIETLDCVVATHAHEDHIGGLDDALRLFAVERVLSPVTDWDSKCFEYFAEAVDVEGLDIEVPVAGDTFTLGGAEITVLGPVKSYIDVNDTSIVLRVQYGDVSVVLAGDAERQSEEDMLESGRIGPADVLKVGHHGSSSGTGYRWLYELSPRYAVISVGAGNDYGHPHEETMSRLRDADVTVYRTDTQGTVVCVSDGKTLDFYTEKAA